MPVASLIRVVRSASWTRSVKASWPQASATKTASTPASSAMRTRSNAACRSRLPCQATPMQSLRATRLRLGAVLALVVLAQEVAAVVVAVRRADDGVDVVLRVATGAERIAVLQRRGDLRPDRADARVVELDQDHRAVNAVVERALRVVGELARPGEVGLGQVALHLIEPHLSVARPQVAGVGLHGAQSTFY